MKSDFYKSIRYIFWAKEAKNINLTRDAFSEMYHVLDESKRVPVGNKTNREVWTSIGSGAWEFDYKFPYAKIYYYNGVYFSIYSTNAINNKKNKGMETDFGRKMQGSLMSNDGTKALKMVRDKFHEVEGTSLLRAFGTTQREYLRCIPKHFYYNILKDNINKFKKNDLLEKIQFSHVSGTDFSSHFPSCACGILPDSHTALEVNKYVKPSKEYPFAFYLDSGHLAIYGEFDTHDWINNKMSNYLFRSDRNVYDPDVTQYPYMEDESTILMKASNRELTKVYEYYYEIKQTFQKDSEEYENAKLVLNASIGKFHTRKYSQNKFAHLAAVIIARANDKMLKYTDLLNKDDIIQVCVDGLIYKGNFRLGVDEEALHNNVQEFLDCDICFKGQNNFIIMKDDKVVKFKHSAYNKLGDGTLISEDNVNNFDDIEKWIRVSSDIEDILKKEKKIK